MNPTTFVLPKSLSSSCSTPFAPIDSPQGPPLKRTDLGSCALGTKGNLQFTAQEGATAPASRAGVLFSEMRRSLADKGADLKAYFGRESPEARAQRKELVEARANSRLIGDLLGSLTAEVDEESNVVNANNCSRIVRALIELNAPATGDLYSLKGAKYCLATYLNELNEFDLVALSQGVLSKERACKDVLDKISTRSDDELRMQMSRLLADIAKAVNQRVLRYTVHEPLSKIVELLAADPVNEQDLRAHLLMLTDDWGTMVHYLSVLPRDEFKKLLDALDFQKLYAFREALQHDGYCSEASRLGLLLKEVVSNFCISRAPRSLFDARFKLQSALYAEDGPVVAHDLRYLSLAVEATYQDWQMLPYPTIVQLQEMVEESMDLFRDWRNNPVGPLNWHSVSKLDDGIRKNLFDAARVLWPFGLQLDPQLRTE